jgi:ribose transport system permease protein
VSLGARDGGIPGIALNLENGQLRATALTTIDYATGDTVTWVQGSQIEDWERPLRRSVQTRVTVDHVMASAALPVLFPAVALGGSWHGDGGVRLHAPLSPAVHLGAHRILAISTRWRGSMPSPLRPPSSAYPSLAQVGGVLLNSVFLDLIDQDALNLQVGSAIALTGVITAVGLRDGWSPPAAVLAGVLVGGLVGLVNALAITRLRVVPFIATLGMLGVARGAAKWVAGQQTVNVPATWVNDLAVTFPSPEWLIVAPGVWLSLALAVLIALVLRNTVFGRRVFALGSNEAAARACGIATDRLKIWLYSLAGLFFGLAGVMQMSRLRQGDPTVAIGTELDVIAAVVIGGGSLSGGEGSILGAMVGALIMAFLRNGSQQMGWPNYIQEIIIGVIIVLAVALDRYRSRAA